MKNKIPTLLLAISLIISFTIIMHATKRVNTFYCIAELDLFYSKTHFVHADIQRFMYSDNSGLTTFRGILSLNGKKYVISRDWHFNLNDDDNDGIMTLTSLGVEKKPNDTVPDEAMWNQIYASGVNYYPAILKTKNEDFIFTDRGVPLYVCAKWKDRM